MEWNTSLDSLFLTNFASISDIFYKQNWDLSPLRSLLMLSCSSNNSEINTAFLLQFCTNHPLTSHLSPLTAHIKT